MTLQTFLAGPHVDVDDLRALIGVIARRVRHHGRIGACDLHRFGFGLADVISAPLRLGAAPQQGIRRDHLGHGHTRAQLFAELAERAIGDSRHRGDGEIVRQCVGTDAHDRG